jgi:biopolymer transport protein ExbD
MKKNRFARASGCKEQMFLQITPMADVLVILLAFLLKSLSMGMSSITPSQSFLLPEAKGSDKVAETLKVEISKERIVFEEKAVAKLTDFAVAPDDMEADGTVRSLNSVLIGLSEQAPPPSEAQSEPSRPVTVMADAAAPYSTIRTVVRTLSKRGYPDLKLLVVQDE